MADADQLLELARQAQGELPEDSEERQRIVDSSGLLGQLLLQDIERKSGDGDGGVSKDRMVSVHDPEMRHGHKSSRRRFDGHRAAIVVDTDTQLITAVAVLPDRPDRQCFPKDDFVIDLAEGSCTCPAGQATHNIVPAGRRTDGMGRVHRLRAFQFDGSECMSCPLRSQCISAKGRKGRWVLIHPQEALLQEARALQQSAGYEEYRRRRVVGEHRLARLVHLGIRQSRYFGGVKTKFQLYLAAKVSLPGGTSGSCSVGSSLRTKAIRSALESVPARLGQAISLALLASAALPKFIPFISPNKDLRPNF